MESDKFDNMVRGALSGASRRGVVRVGISALAASALTTMGLRSSDDAAAKKKKKPVCNCTSSNAATCTTQKLGKNARNKLLISNPCAYNGDCQAGVSGCQFTCPAATPVACSFGCCPSTFSQCCTAPVSDYSPGAQTCNPPNFTCCPAEVGGGSCDPHFPTCCPPARDTRFRSCAAADEKCCTAAQGGGVCDSNQTCCPPNLNNPADNGSCCDPGEACCVADTDCPAGQICDGAPNEAGCCVVPVSARSGRSNRRKSGGAERFVMVAR